MNHSTILKALHYAVIERHAFHVRKPKKDMEFIEAVKTDMAALYEMLFPGMDAKTNVQFYGQTGELHIVQVETLVEIDRDRFVQLVSTLDLDKGTIIQ